MTPKTYQAIVLTLLLLLLSGLILACGRDENALLRTSTAVITDGDSINTPNWRDWSQILMKRYGMKP